MKALRQAIVSQFRKPSGFAGRIAGRIMAARSSNRQRSLRTVDLLDLQPTSRVLEIGCGPGLALLECARRAHRGTITGLDHSPLMIEQARHRLIQAGLRDSPGIQLQVGDARDIEKIDQEFHAVFSVNVVQFLPDLPETFSLIAGRLLPGGRVATTYQPRSADPARADIDDMALGIESAMAGAGFLSITSHAIALGSASALCVTGEVPARSRQILRDAAIASV